MAELRQQLVNDFEGRVQQSGVDRERFHRETMMNMAAINGVVESTRDFIDGHLFQYLLQCDRVCELIAKALNLPDDLIFIFRSGAKSHDVGKSKFPKEYPTYPLKNLDDYRFGHLVHSVGMIEPHIRGLSGSMILQIVGHHHERANRSGPMGVEHTHLLSQLFALADEFITILWPPHPKDPNAKLDAAARFAHMKRMMLRNVGNEHFSGLVVNAFHQLIGQGVFDDLKLDNFFGSRITFGEVRTQATPMHASKASLPGLRSEASGKLREV